MTEPAFQTSQQAAPAPERFFNETFLRRLEQLAILSRRAMAGQMQGERRSSKRGQSVEFSDFRPYAMGDDFRRIDWNAYARLERFFIKLFVEEEDLTVHLLVDVSRSMDWGAPNKLHYALRAAGALGYVALVGLDRVTVTALGHPGARSGTGYLAPLRGKRQALALFDFLQNLARSATRSPRQSALAPRLRAYAAAITRPGPLVLLSDLMDDGWADGLRALASRGFEVSVLHVLSPDEIDPGLEGDLKLRDVESGVEVEITADFDLLQRYRDGLAGWQEELRGFCNARGMHYAPVETCMPLDELLFAWLRQRGVLK